MRRLHIRTNEKSDALRGLVYFAQCIDELLFDHTHDSYRSPALNTPLRVLEISLVANQLRGTPYFSRTIPSFLEELEWSITEDPILNAVAKGRLRREVGEIRKSLDRPEAVIYHISSMLLEFDKYSDELRSQLMEVVLTSPNEKARILAMASCFSVQIEYEGYHRRYGYFGIKRLIDRLSHDKTISPDRLLERFMRRLPSDPKQKKFSVVMKGSEQFRKYVPLAKMFDFQVMEAAPTFDKTNEEAKAWIAGKKGDERFLVFENVEAIDPMRARDIAESTVKGFRASVDYVSHQEDLSWSREAVVSESPLGASLLRGAVDPMHCGVEVDEKAGEIVEIVAEVMHEGHLQPGSSYRFRNALSYHAAALHASQLENQLVDLWAALEGLLLEAESHEARNAQIMRAVGPCLMLAYVDELFLVLAKELKQDPQANDIINKLLVKGSDLQKAAAFCVCEEFEAERIQLGKKIADSNPLLLYRTHALRERFRSRHRVRKTLVAHHKKIAWHVNRIYFTRNSIVHTAEALPYLAMLVQHLHMYLDTTVRCIATMAVKSKYTASIGQIAAHLGSHWDEQLLRLSQKDEVDCTLMTYMDILVGVDNPVSQFERL